MRIRGRRSLVLAFVAFGVPWPAFAQAPPGALPPWRQVAAGPSPRVDASLAYDASRGLVVMHGGTGGDSGLNDTWTFDGAVWRPVSSASDPGGSDNAPMAYDPLLRSVVLLGGAGTTWTFDGATWHPIATFGGPYAQCRMAFLPSIGKVVLLAWDGSTWGLDASGWTQLVPADAGPPRRTTPGLVYDAHLGRLLLFGGLGADGPLDDSWTFDGATWTQLAPSVSPPASRDVALAYDPVRARSVLFSAATTSGGLSGTWSFDGATWTQQSSSFGPAPRWGAYGAFMDGLGRLVTFGGAPGGTYESAETWTFDGAVWTQVATPPAFAPMAVDPSTSRPLAVATDGTTWTWDGATWVRLPVATLSGTRDAVLATDAARGRVVLLDISGSTWTWDGTGWSQAAPAASPPARSLAGMAWDPARQAVVLFGGLGTSGLPLADTWTFDGVTWTSAAPAATPSGRVSPAMAWDPVTASVLLFGGASSAGSLADTWRWDGTSWQATSASGPAGGPSAMALDADVGGPVLLDGSAAAWSWTGSAWASQTAAGTLPPGVLGFSAPTHQLVLAGATTWVSGGAVGNVTVSLARTTLLAGGSDSTTVTAVVTDAGGQPAAGLPVRFEASGGQAVGSVTDHGDGSYTAALTSSPPVGSFTLAARVFHVTGRTGFSQIDQQVTWSPSDLDFGTLGLGIASPSRTVAVTVAGTTSVTFAASTLSGTNAADFTIASDGCGAAGSLPSGATCQIGVTFTPTATGARTASLRINDNTFGSPHLVGLAGHGASLSLSPPSIAFGAQTTGTTSPPVTVTVTNHAPGDVTLSALSFAGANSGDFAFSSNPCAGSILPPLASCTLGVTFAPQGEGARSAALTVASSAADSPHTATLTGTGVAPVVGVLVSPTSLAFGQVAVGSSSASSTITLTSTGTAPLSVTAVALAGNQPKDFTLVDGGCTAGPIAPGQSCTVTVSFTPRSFCGASAQVVFADDAPGSPRAVTLSGTGILGGAMVPFQSTLYCTSPGAGPQEFSANVDGKVWFDEYGSRVSPPAIATVTATSGVQEDRGAVTPGWTLWGLTIAPDGSRAYTESRPLVGLYLDIAGPTAPVARYPLPGNAGPLGVGPDGAFWYAEEVSCGYAPLITRYLPGSPPVSYTASPFWLAAHVKGCAIPTLVTAGPDGNVWISLTALKGGVIAPPSRSGLLRLTTDGTPLDFLWLNAVLYAATLGPDGDLYALTGTGVSTGCELRRFTAIGASSTVPLPGSVRPACRSMTTGPDGRIWMVGEVGDISSPVRSMIAVGTSGVVTTYPAPTGLYLAAGPDAGLWFDADDSTVGRFDLGGSPARAFVSPASISFPSTSLAVRSELRDVRILSAGTGPLSLGALSLQGSEASNFVLVDTCSGTVLAPGASCVVRVASRPLRPGSHRATLVVPSDDTFSPRVVQLLEYTLPPPPIATPSMVSFPTTSIGDHSPPATLTLTNPADLALHVDSVGIDGANAGDFAIDTDRCSATDVPAGGSCTVTVRFGPTASGHRVANVTFVDLGITPTQTVALAGEGAGAPPPEEPCQCSSTGGFVNPVVVDPVAAATSPHGLFHLEVSQSGARPSHFTITNASGAVVWDWTPPVDATWPVVSPWGFSPDDKRFVLHYATLGADWIELFDLARPDPRVHAWASSEIIDTWAPATSPAGSMGFSPDGAVLLTVQLQRNQSDQRAFLNLVTASGSRVQSVDWNLPSMAPSDASVGSAFWGFSPDSHSFTFMRIDATGSPQLTLFSLPSGTEVQHLYLGSSVATYVQFAPCGEVLGVVTQATDPLDPAPTNPVTISLYSTSPTARGAPPLRSVYDLPAATIAMAAGPQNYTAEVEDYPNTVILAPNTSAGGTCAPPEASSPGGGSDVPPPVYGPTFTDKTPPLTAIAGTEYTYTFAADGEPTPVFALTVAPSWLTIDPDSGTVSGTPPLAPQVATYTFTYSVHATNGLSFDDAGPFAVTVHPPAGPTLTAATPPPTAIGALGPKAAPPSAASALPSLPAPNLLLLPHGRGQIELPADVTPAVSIFTYAETDRRAGPLGHLAFAGLGFTFTAVDATTGSSVTVLADAPRVTLAFGDAELRAARIRDLSTLGLYWWSGSAWVNQLPCPGCGADPTTRTLSARLAKLGEYALAAAPPPPPTLAVTPETLYTAAGVPFAGVLATFLPPDPGDEASRFAVTVRWGDQQASGALLSRSDDGTFVIAGVHTWNAPGTYPVVLTVWSGGASQDVGTTALVATTTGAPMFSAAAPPLTVTEGALYAYAFAAVGVPAPTFALAAGAPSWLSMDATTGVLSGTPPRGTALFTYSVLASNGVGPDATAGPFVVTVVLTRGYYTVTPCRVFDSRHAGLGGPNPLLGGSTTPVPIAGRCGIPPEATAVALNVTVTAPTGPGHLTLFPDGTPRPLASVSNYASGQTRANNAAIPLGASGSLDVFVGQASGSAHVIVDVSGYFR